MSKRPANPYQIIADSAATGKIRESWLRAKAAARVIPCTFIGKHLRFSDDDITQIMAGAPGRR